MTRALKRAWGTIRHHVKWFYYRHLADLFDPGIRVSSLLIIFACLLIALFLINFAALRKDFLNGVFIEFTGLVFDLFFFGILIHLHYKYHLKNNEIKRLLEIIDDFKRWDSKEAACRIAGATKRLIRMGETNIDFVGIRLTDFNFHKDNIFDISGSKFQTATDSFHGKMYEEKKDKFYINNTNLTRVDFSEVNCLGVVFGIAGGVETTLNNCLFKNSCLRNTNFTGCRLLFDEKPKNEFVEKPFRNADLHGAIFDNCLMKFVDFRGANNLKSATFRNCRGIESCMFDNSVDIKSLHTITDPQLMKKQGRITGSLVAFKNRQTD